MTTATSLRSQTAKTLAEQAKKDGVPGWHSMRKEQLVTALLKLARQKQKKNAAKSSANGKASKVTAKNGSASRSRSKTNGAATKTSASRTTRSRVTRKGKPATQNARVVRIIREEKQRREQMKDLARVTSTNTKADPEKDRVVLIVRDPYWIQAYWEITRATVERANVALTDHWHATKPIIRLFEVSEESKTHAAEKWVRDIPVHGGVKNWFIDVPDPPKAYRIAIGYLLPNNKFYLIAKSNEVTTPIPSSSETVDHSWTDIAMNHQKFYALSGGYSEQPAEDLRDVFEEQLRRPMSTPMFAQIATQTLGGVRNFDFAVNAEMMIYGTADPNATVTLAGEPVRLRNDGTFEVRMSLPDCRQVLPVVACSRDGTEQRTTVIAIERNTKVMEPISRDLEET